MNFSSWVWSEDDTDRLRRAFAKRFGEDQPRTETLYSVAAEGIRIHEERTFDMAAEIARLRADLAEMTRRRDEWRAKAEGYDEVRAALREKVGSPWPPHLSRVMWAGVAADEKKRADDAEAKVAEMAALVDVSTEYGSGVSAAYAEGFEDGWDAKLVNIYPFAEAQAQGWEDSWMLRSLRALAAQEPGTP